MLNWKERGTTESENSSGYDRVKSRWETTQKSLPCWSVFTMAGTEKGYAFIQHRNKHIRTGQFSFSHCRFDTFESLNEKQVEAENVMVHAPYHLAYVVECAFMKVPWSSIIQGGWFSVSAGIQFEFLNVWTFKVCRFAVRAVHLFQRSDRIRWDWSAECRLTLRPLTMWYKISLRFAKCWSERILQACSVPI